MCRPKYSFIVPVFNVEGYLTECIESIISQTVHDWELILVDDGSTDASGNICDAFSAKDQRIATLHQSNRGVSNARNHGLDVASGERICFVDSDDWIAPNYLEQLDSQAEDIDIVFFPFIQVYQGIGQESRILLPQVERGREAVEKVLYDLKYGPLGDLFGWTVVKCIRSSIISNHHIRFNESLPICEDWIFTLEVCRYITSIRIIDTPLYYYRMLGDSLHNKGILPHSMPILADCIQKSLSYYSYLPFINEEKKCIADFRLEHFVKTRRIRSLHKSIEYIRCSFPKDSDTLSFASNIRLAHMLSHSFVISYIIVLLDLFFDAIKGRLK